MAFLLSCCNRPRHKGVKQGSLLFRAYFHAYDGLSRSSFPTIRGEKVGI